jgi:acyl-CoA thioesterase-1
VFHSGGLWNENASSSSFTLSRIDTWLAFRDIKCKTAPPHPGANKIEIHNPTVDFSTYRLKWDVIVCNWGMWEIINDGKPANSVPVEKYATNLTSLFDKMKATGAILIWATTTPVPEKNKRGRREADVVAYNAAAQKVVDAAGAVTVDLHGLVAAKLTSDWRRNGNAEEVHFNDAGNQFLAGHINAAIQAALARRK